MGLEMFNLHLELFLGYMIQVYSSAAQCKMRAIAIARDWKIIC